VLPKAEDVYEILCNEQVLPLDMTLAAVRQFLWRQAAELVMYYRKKPSSLPVMLSTQGDEDR
jgi:WD repeat-containing protein 48